MPDESKMKPPPLPPLDELTAEDVYGKLYDVTNDDPMEPPHWIADTGGVPDVDTLRDELPPGSYLIILRARKGNALGRKPGTIVHRGINLHVPGEPTKETDVPPPAGTAQQRPPVTTQAPGTAVENSAVATLGDLVREISIGKQQQDNPINAVRDTLTIIKDVQNLTNARSDTPSSGDGEDLAKQRLAKMFDDGIALGTKIGQAMAAGDGSDGNSKGNAILAILERVLAHPTIKDVLARASAPVVNLDELTAAMPQNEEEPNG